MGVSVSLPKLKLYLAPTSQSSWSKRPWHVSLSSSLWTDLLMVAILFRLNEFALAHLLGGFSGMWQPITVFFAIYDVWETRVLFDSVFMYQDDLVHQFLGIIQWLLLALMATAITPSPVWGQFDALLFSSFKLAHQTVRVLNYMETSWLSQSKRARKAASVRSIVYVAGWPFSLAALAMFAIGGYSTDLAAGMWVAGFFVQRLIWAYLKWDPFPSKRFRFGQHARSIKTNIPFKTTRYSDWTMLQLGAIILGFMTVPTTSLGSYGVLIFGYTYVAALNLLAYSMNPEDPAEHALIKGGLREFVWLEFFSLGGLAFMGIAVGLRVHLFYPTLVILPQNRHYTWVLCICAMVSTISMFGQEYCHGGKVARLNGPIVVVIKILTSGLYLVGAGAFIASNTHVVAFLILSLALVSLAVLLLQVMNGAFRRQIIKTYHTKLMGHFWAAVIGVIWKRRAQRRLQERGGYENAGDRHESITLTLGMNGVKHSLSMPLPDTDDSSFVQSKTSNSTSVAKKHSLPTSLDTSSVSESLFGVGNHLSIPSVDTGSDNHTASSSQRRYNRASFEHRARRLSEVVKNEIRVIKVVLNDRIYAHPNVIIEGNKATKYKVQWSDLFFDVIYVGVVFRLGDLLLAGIGAGYSEKSVHYEIALGGSNTTLYSIPRDPPRSDAVFIFAAVFVAVWAMWQNKLAYSSKVATSDVVHKIVDMCQGLFVLLCAVNITTPSQMQNKNSGNAYAVTGSLLAFQLSMVCLWIEVYFSDGKKDSRAQGTALRNIKRDSFTVLPLLCSFATIATGVTLSVTAFLWSLSWLLPFAMRVLAVRVVNDHNAVRDLHRYVIHRLGDGALIILGEGVLQIIRAETSLQVFSYLAIAIGLFVMTLTRIAVWSMDCFTDPSKHAQLLSLDAGLAAYFIRSITAPSLVAMGVALKKMVGISSDHFDRKNQGYYWLLVGASTIALFSLVITYELHRFAYHRKWRTREFAIMMSTSIIFVCWGPIPAPGWVIQTLCMSTWLIAVILHFFLDDYFLLKEQVRKKAHNESTGLKRADSRYSARSRTKSRFFDIEGQCCRRIIDHMSLFISPPTFRGRLDRETLPPTKKMVPIEQLPSVQINDPMVPAVGILEKQASISKLSLAVEQQSEYIANNPNFDGHVVA